MLDRFSWILGAKTSQKKKKKKNYNKKTNTKQTNKNNFKKREWSSLQFLEFDSMLENFLITQVSFLWA